MNWRISRTKNVETRCCTARRCFVNASRHTFQGFRRVPMSACPCTVEEVEVRGRRQSVNISTSKTKSRPGGRLFHNSGGSRAQEPRMIGGRGARQQPPSRHIKTRPVSPHECPSEKSSLHRTCVSSASGAAHRQQACMTVCWKCAHCNRGVSSVTPQDTEFHLLQARCSRQQHAAEDGSCLLRPPPVGTTRAESPRSWQPSL